MSQWRWASRVTSIVNDGSLLKFKINAAKAVALLSFVPRCDNGGEHHGSHPLSTMEVFWNSKSMQQRLLLLTTTECDPRPAFLVYPYYQQKTQGHPLQSWIRETCLHKNAYYCSCEGLSARLMSETMSLKMFDRRTHSNWGPKLWFFYPL